MKAQQELPLYRTHSTDETVRAVKIAKLEDAPHADATLITPEDVNFSPFLSPRGWPKLQGGSPDDPGYFVQHPDSVEGWMTTQEFEDRYSLSTDV